MQLRKIWKLLNAKLMWTGGWCPLCGNGFSKSVWNDCEVCSGESDSLSVWKKYKKYLWMIDAPLNVKAIPINKPINCCVDEANDATIISEENTI